MTISTEIKERIEREAALLTRRGISRPGMSYDDFTKNFAQIIAQSKLDRTILEATGMDFSQMPYFEALLETLHGDGRWTFVRLRQGFGG